MQGIMHKFYRMFAFDDVFAECHADLAALFVCSGRSGHNIAPTAYAMGAQTASKAPRPTHRRLSPEYNPPRTPAHRQRRICRLPCPSYTWRSPLTMYLQNVTSPRPRPSHPHRASSIAKRPWHMPWAHPLIQAPASRRAPHISGRNATARAAAAPHCRDRSPSPYHLRLMNASPTRQTATPTSLFHVSASL